jgi:hypothetical protein
MGVTRILARRGENDGTGPRNSFAFDRCRLSDLWQVFFEEAEGHELFMMRRCFLALLVMVSLAVMTLPASACSVCYGNPEAPLTKAAGWGVVVLMGVVLVVLGGIVGFFAYLAKRSSIVASQTAQSISETINKS